MKKVERIIRGWGEPVTVTQNGNTVNSKALIHPINRRWRTYLSGERVPSGILDKNHYIMVASPGLELGKCDEGIVESSSDSYFIRSCGDFKVKGKKLYVWAVLAARTEPSEADDYD